MYLLYIPLRSFARQNNHENAWSCDRQASSTPGRRLVVRVHVGGLVSNNAAEKLVVRLLLQATHAATSLVLKLLIMHARRRDIFSTSPPLSKRALDPPPRPLSTPSSPSAHLSCAGPRRLVSVFCDDPLLCITGIASRPRVPVMCI